jgi:DNA-binding transcriptional ArsR family regulator
MGALQNEPKKADLQLTAVLYALSDETRLQIVQSLAKTHEIACSYFDIHMPKSSLSHHFRVLRASGLITTRKEGTALLNRLRREDLEERFPGVLESVLASSIRSSRQHLLRRGKMAL